VFIEANDDGSGGDNWSYVLQSLTQIVTTNRPTSNFLQTGWPSYRPTNSVKGTDFPDEQLLVLLVQGVLE